MEKQLNDRDITLMLKAALEYNAGIIALCTQYYGNVDARNSKKLSKSLLTVSRKYREQLESIINESL